MLQHCKIHGFVRVALACAALVACRESTSVEGSLQDARNRWISAGVASYDYTLQVACFCAPPVTRAVTISVRNGIVVSRHYEDNGEAVPDALATSFPTIDGLFIEIQNAIDRGAASVTASYDAGRGFPTHVFIDNAANAADDEVSLSVHGFVQR